MHDINDIYEHSSGVVGNDGEEPSDSSWTPVTPPLENDPIVIVGIGCRLPGAVSSPSELWEMLKEGRSGQCDVPPSRFNIDAFHHKNGEHPGSMSMRGGYFLQDDIQQFENGVFGINNLEATYMDPQQRKLLEVVYEAFENSGTTLEDISGANIGCYIGSFGLDFSIMQSRDPEYFHRYGITGMGPTILGNRISHAFNLKGPSLVLDTACSSSLYCLHVACMALANRECDGAVVAAANLIQSPEQQMAIMKVGVLSPTSTCHVFDSSADGYGRAEAVNAIYLKRLSDAIRDNDQIHAVVRATAVNSNGNTPGITTPSIKGQEAVIRKAYRAAGLDLRETSFVECHGTGTAAGDPIEVEALSNVFTSGRDSDSPLLLGSVKSNLGHGEAASGLSSIIKTALILQHGLIPATIGIKNVNPKIKLEQWNIKIPTEMTKWPRTDTIMRASVNSFGYGGANAHAIMESIESYLQKELPVDRSLVVADQRSFFIPISGTSMASLEKQVSGLSIVNDHMSVADLAYGLCTGRSRHDYRGYLQATKETLEVSLHSALVSGKKGNNLNDFAFIFTGQGAQWPGMGKELFHRFSQFRAVIEDMNRALQSIPERPNWQLQDILQLLPDGGSINDPSLAQPLVTAIQVGIVNLLSNWGIRPTAVLGHSSGEIAAAYAAGILTSEQSILISYYRGYSVLKCTLQGGMLVAALSPKEAEAEIEKHSMAGKVVIACYNSAESITLSGDMNAISTLQQDFKSRKVLCKKLDTGNRAYHSPHMKEITKTFEALVYRSVGPTFAPVSDIRMISSVTEEIIQDSISGYYFRQNAELPVRFTGSLEVLLKSGPVHLIEIGPHSALELPIKQTIKKMQLEESRVIYSPTIIRGQNAVDNLFTLAGNLFISGYPIRLHRINDVAPSSSLTQNSYYADKRALFTHLPKFKWTYDSLLIAESRASSEFRNRRFVRHDLLGSQIPGGNGLERTWRNILNLKDISWIKDHKLDETIVFPAACFLAMSIEALTQVFELAAKSLQQVTLRDVHILAAFALPSKPEDGNPELFTTLRSHKLSATTTSKIWNQFEISSVNGDSRIQHVVGWISGEARSKVISSRLDRKRLDFVKGSSSAWYDRFIASGLKFGDSFQSLQDIHTSKGNSANRVIAETVPEIGKEDTHYPQSRYLLHPILIDAILQASIIASTAGDVNKLSAKVPVAFGTIELDINAAMQHPETTTIEASAVSTGVSTIKAQAEMRGGTEGKVIMKMEDTRLTSYYGTSLESAKLERQPMQRALWVPDLISMLQNNPKELEFFLNDELISKKMSKSDRIRHVLELITRKNPWMHILRIVDNCLEDDTKSIRDFQSLRCGSHHVAQIVSGEVKIIGGFDAEGNVVASDMSYDGPFDLILQDVTINRGEVEFLPTLDWIQRRLVGNGVLIAVGAVDSYTDLSLENYFFNLLTVQLSGTNKKLQLSIKKSEQNKETLSSDEHIILVDSKEGHSMAKLLEQKLQHQGYSTALLKLGEITDEKISVKATIICMFELDRPHLAFSTDEEFLEIQLMVSKAQNILWLTSGDITRGLRPDFSIVTGLARAAMREQPSLRFITYDIDQPNWDVDVSLNYIIPLLKKNGDSIGQDLEFAQRGKCLYINRFEVDKTLNTIFRQGQENEKKRVKFDDIKPCALDISRAGSFDTIFFKNDDSVRSLLPNDHVQVSVQSVGLNAKDVYVLAGKVETKNATCTLEVAGVIEKVGSSVTSFCPGDRVVVLAPGNFRSSERYPEWACRKLNDEEDPNVMCTLPVAFATSLYGLNHCARLARGETVLIHSGAGGVGIAAIQIAKIAGAEIFTTASTEDKANFLVEKLGVRRDHIFSSRNSDFVQGIIAATHGKGVDVVLNSLTGDLLHDSLGVCGQFGRFIEIGKRDIIDSGQLNMLVFQKNLTFTAFDLSDLYYHENQATRNKLGSLFTEVLDLYRQGMISPIMDPKVFDISDLTYAFRHFSSTTRLGKISISFQSNDAMVDFVPPKYTAAFDPNKAYLLVGCLGGLGKSISKWMQSRGAKNFVFLARSGTKKATAKQHVLELREKGADVLVVNGDVCNEGDVERAVNAIDAPLGGIIQAAMGLDESLITSMSNTSWHRGLKPKLQGTWNLHNAIKGKDSALDFFLMTSSVSGSIGSATEANYCAANAFLNNFARYRRSLGLPAIAVGLGMISGLGYVHDNPDIQKLLQRRGLQAITEEDLLQIIDISLASCGSEKYLLCDSLGSSHILTGLDPVLLKESRDQGITEVLSILEDPRSRSLGVPPIDETDKGTASRHALPKVLLHAMGSDESDASVLVSIATLAKKQLSDLILQPFDKLDPQVFLSQYGLDSMLAAEYRTWFYQTFQIDIPYLDMLAPSATISKLSGIIYEQLVKS
ncbi:Polyketide synthase-nonribosomal peptide synthetase 3 [Phlyctema vagabunda]|uniref:Polyketide synthase-nonribosomal peptide synthetase 3 n=1 Tax=Phlyctema vagabunda TaxID=108571 RepID=A0ABR4P707_9HELO